MMEQLGNFLDSTLAFISIKKFVERKGEYLSFLQKGKKSWGKYYSTQDLILQLEAGLLTIVELRNKGELRLCLLVRTNNYATRVELEIGFIIGEGYFANKETMGMLLDHIENLAASHGYTHVTMPVKQAFVKGISTWGYGIEYVQLIKDLQNG